MQEKDTKSKISIISLGCSKNTVDSEVLAAKLSKNGFTVYYNRPADIIIVNTCGFIFDAKQESIDTILEYTSLKNQGLIKKIFVIGCLAQRYKEEIVSEIPEIDGCYGINEISELMFSIAGKCNTTYFGREISTPAHYSYLKIAEGCNRRCSFCSIPLIKGPLISREIESLINESELLARKGVKELNIIAQDTTAYGTDIYGKKMLAHLLDNIASLELFKWIRLHYTYPSDFPMDLPQVIKEHPSICNYIDIPLQHISDKILKSMKRGINSDCIKKLLEKLRDTIPELAIRTTFIVGYPGETDKDFKELLDFVKEQKFERAGVFTYSHEEGTTAFSLKNSVTKKLMKERAAELMEIQQAISENNNKKFLSKEIDVIIDKKENDYFIGRTEYDSPEIDNEILIPVKRKKLIVGEFYRVRITETDVFDLYGEVC